VRPRLGWVNDPNGPIWLQGRCHLFFQYAPEVCPEAGDVVWGHSSSADLVTWDIHGTALQPSPEHPCAQGFCEVAQK
jgi:beta-fructofuranosidase